MDPTTLKALQDSITHWENNATPGKFEGIHSATCALCTRFNWRYDNLGSGADPDINCTRLDGEQCPVMLNTTKSGCAGTPWRAVSHQAIIGPPGTEQFTEFHEAARNMVTFLENLLPKDPTT